MSLVCDSTPTHFHHLRVELKRRLFSAESNTSVMQHKLRFYRELCTVTIYCLASMFSCAVVITVRSLNLSLVAF